MTNRDRAGRRARLRGKGGAGRIAPEPVNEQIHPADLVPSGKGGPAPATPDSAGAIFGASVTKIERYAEILAVDGVARGLVGPREAPRIWDRHILNCAAVDSLMPRSGSVLDLGSGAGLPGIVLAIMRSGIEFLLLEPLLRRCVFLEACKRELELHNTTVIRGRAEDYAGQLACDAVVARAVAPLDRLVRWATPLLRPGGALLAIKGADAAAELAAAGDALKEAGALDPELVDIGKLDARATVIVVTRGQRPA